MSTGSALVQCIYTQSGFYTEGGEEGYLWKGDDVFLDLYQQSLTAPREGIHPSERYLYMVADAFFSRLSDLPGLEVARENAQAKLDTETADRLLYSVPFVHGSEFVTAAWIENIFAHLQAIFKSEMGAFDGSVEQYFSEKNQKLRVPERIFFHLVENRNAEDLPFAFLATYASKDQNGRVRHYPLKYALTEYKADREHLVNLLSCLSKAANVCDLISEFMQSGELFHPLRLDEAEAYEILQHVEAIEEAGILCRIPAWWKKQNSSIQMALKIGEVKPSLLGFDSLVSMRPSLSVDGVDLTEADIKLLLSQSDGLHLLKGRWVEVNHRKLEQLLEKMNTLEKDITLLDALRMQSGDDLDPDGGVMITNGEWLSGMLSNLRHPETMKELAVPESMNVELRSYQKTGYAWLNYMDSLGFGACLADDMGLGKTVQVLTYLESLRARKPKSHVLLVVPASLLGNWKKEAERFAPKLDFIVLHGQSPDNRLKIIESGLPFLTITTYGMMLRIEELREKQWACLILDEAQAIKNPLAKQTRAAKQYKSEMRIAMTGTPIENDLSNLWSLFDFLDKGLLGSSDRFKAYCSDLDQHAEKYSHLKALIAPFMLRRVKSDKSLLPDLPDKIEMTDHVQLAKKQVVLYRKEVADMEEKVKGAIGFARGGIILGTLLRLKQICNHPDQFLGQEAFDPGESGKFAMLKEICETIAEKRERVLVFTQYREMTEPLAFYLKTIFHREGYVIDGRTPVTKRTAIVEAFQGEKYVPFIVISVKAGGTGLNLTNASHVIHFDRWWNPAVENQATDRAYRIGQKNNVMVHKLVSEGTVEEKIDALIASKKDLAESVIGSGGEKWITELGDDELMDLLRLDG